MSVRRGFVLLEAVAAVAIVAAVGLAAIQVVGQHDRAATSISAALFATTLAHERLQAVRLSDMRQLPQLHDSIAAGVRHSHGQVWLWKTTVLADHELAGLYWVDVRVSGSAVEREAQTAIFVPPLLRDVR
jgi:type II secretion system protein I